MKTNKSTQKKKMNEKELQKFYDNKQEDLSLWQDEPVSAQVGKGEGSVVFSLRFSPSELQDLRLQAEAKGMTLSEMIRRAALEWGRNQQLNIEQVRGPSIVASTWRTRLFSKFVLRSASIELTQGDVPNNFNCVYYPSANADFPSLSQPHNALPC